MNADDRTPFDDYMEEFLRREAGPRDKGDPSEDEQPLTSTRFATGYALLLTNEVAVGLCLELVARYAPNVPRETMVKDLLTWVGQYIEGLRVRAPVGDVIWTEHDSESFDRLLDVYEGLLERNIQTSLTSETDE